MMLNLISLLGLFTMVLLAWLMSSHKRMISWRVIVGGLLLQLVFAGILFQSQNWTFSGKFENGVLFYGINHFFVLVNECVEAGSGFVFNYHPADDDTIPVNPAIVITSFAFGVLPTVIFFASLMSVLYYLGIMQWIVRGMAWVMQRTLGTSGAESLAAAANVFVGHTEAPLVVRPYLGTMTRSELNALMVGGFATITGGLLAAFVKMGISAGHLVVASIVSAPAALLIAKLLQPETEQPETLGTVKTQMERVGVNLIDAAAIGARDGVKLAINIAAMLIAFLALIALVDALLAGLGNLCEGFVNRLFVAEPLDFQWSLAGLFGYLFWPLAWIMGIEARDCAVSGDLLGKKMVINEFVAYLDLGQVIRSGGSVLQDGTTLPQISDRTEVILTYALAGFSNFGAIAIQIGGIGSLAENRRSDLAQLGLRAMLGGMLACCMTACIAGIMYGLFD